MATVEQQREGQFPPEGAIQTTPEQLDNATFRETGITPTPVHPPTVIDPKTQEILAQSSAPAAEEVVVSSVPTLTIPIEQAQAESYSHGSIDDSKTWMGATVVRQVKKALHLGWKVIVGK